MLAQWCFTAWNVAMTRPNCSRTFAYSAAISVAPRATPTASADKMTRDRSRNVVAAPVSVVAAAPSRATRPLRRVGSRFDGTSTFTPLPRRSTRTASPPTRTSRRSAVPAPTATATVPRKAPSRSSSFPSSANAAVRLPSASPGRCVLRVASSASATRTALTTTVGTRAPGVTARPSSSIATTRSVRSPPAPPYSSGMCSPSTPIPTRSGHAAGGFSSGASRRARASARASRRRRTCETESASARWSSVIAMGMAHAYQARAVARTGGAPGYPRLWRPATRASGARLHRLGEADLSLAAQHVLEQLARRVARQLLAAKLDVRRDLEVGQRLRDPHLHLVGGEVVAVGDLDDRLDLLAEGGMRHPAHGRVAVRGVLAEPVLDLDAVHVLATADDHVLGAVGDVEEALAVDMAE